ncbi:MAG: AAA family ATPase [Bacteroidota bacterium]|nr:AAA family ATPase [Bacteroidota bacterium]
MIKRIKIKNFKALKLVEIDLSEINIFTGLNGMGKSTILQALLLLRQSSDTLGREINLKGDLVDIGEYQDAFCECATEDHIIQFRLTQSDETVLNFESEYSASKKKEVVMDTKSFQCDKKDISLFNTDTFIYLSANRITPSDSYSTNLTAINKRLLGNQGQFAPHFYHQNCNNDIPIKGLAFDSEDEVFSLEYQLNRWMDVISPSVQVHTEINNELVVLRYSYKTKSLNTSKYKAKNAGFGLTYVFSVLVAILSAKPGDMLILENPESHIHPRGQSELARLLALAAKNGVQVFVETHSDHILYGIRIAIKEKDITKENAKIYYFDRDDEEHFSNVRQIEIDDYGRMERSVRQYFREYESHLDRLMS